MRRSARGDKPANRRELTECNFAPPAWLDIPGGATLSPADHFPVRNDGQIPRGKEDVRVRHRVDRHWRRTHRLTTIQENDG